MPSDQSPRTLDDAVAWAAGALGTTVRSVRPLTGGLSAGMAGISTAVGEFALRWWEERSSWSDVCLARQQTLLDALVATDLPVPRCVASDPQVPASLTSWLPGEIDLDPANPQRWLASLAETLASIHAVPLPSGVPLSDSAADPKINPDLGWLGDVGLAAEAMAVITTPWADQPALLHGDYQHFNVVWCDGRLSGVIDWPLGGSGDRGLDVGHCRLNLAVLFGTGTAMEFLDRYETVAGQPVSAGPDLAELLAFSAAWEAFIPRQVAGRRPVDGPGMATRVRETLVRTLRRAG